MVQMMDMRKAPLVEGQAGKFLEILKDLHWKDYLMEFQVDRLRYIHWVSHLVYMVELREAPPMGCQVGMVWIAEGSALVESLGSESVTEVVSSKGLSEGNFSLKVPF